MNVIFEELQNIKRDSKGRLNKSARFAKRLHVMKRKYI